MKNFVSNISSIRDVAVFWKDCIDEFGRLSDIEVVMMMLSVARSQYFLNLYDSKENSDVIMIFDTLTHLDVPEIDFEDEKRMWSIIRNHLYELEQFI